MSELHQVAWRPDDATVRNANVTAVMHRRGLDSYADLHRWSIEDRAAFWQMVLDRLGIVFDDPPKEILIGSPRQPTWLPAAGMNIVDSCFTAPAGKTAVVYRNDGSNRQLSYGELRSLVDGFARGPADRNLGVGHRVSIADSFAPHEIATRLRMTDPALVVTQDRFVRSGSEHPMFQKVADADAPPCVVVDTGGAVAIRDGDITWDEFLGNEGAFDPVPCAPDGHVNILFSSGTTGEPKAIPWTHLTAFKSAMDGHFHHDIHPDDLVAWPSNLGWMLGPWLIFATLINGATMALCDDAPTGRGFIDFVRDTGVTVLGFVPSVVAPWRASGLLADSGWTEIGGGYISATVVHDAIPATFTTPPLGLDVRIPDDENQPSDNGEMYIVPPSFGLSQELLGRDHDEVYYAGVPESDVVLLRHGDHMERLPNGYFRALGRVDDTMNLGGVKISSAELERVVGAVVGVVEVAVVAVSPAGGGPSRLVIYGVAGPGVQTVPEVWKREMRQAIRSELNPLFRIHEVVVVDVLPRTASAKVMRRELRARYE